MCYPWAKPEGFSQSKDKPQMRTKAQTSTALLTLLMLLLPTTSTAHCTVNHPGHCLKGVAEQVGQTYQQIEQGVNQSLRQVFGDDVANLVSFVRLPDTLETSMNLTIVSRSADLVSGDVKFEDLLKQRIGAPLEAALLQAKAQLAGRGEPIPEDVRQLLAVSFLPEVIDRTRVIDSGVEGNLPAIINTLRTSIGDAAGGNHAVVVDNIIVFDHIPSVDFIAFWAHEVTHVEQYGRMGISGFADAYTTNYKKIEEEADARAWRLVTELDELLDLQRFSLFLISYRGGVPRYCDHVTISDVRQHTIYQCGFVASSREERKLLYDNATKWQWPKPCDHVTLEDAVHYGICDP